jgi:hypothetical protein
VITLGLRLTLRGGREAAVRLAVTTAAVGLGVALLLATLGGIRAVDEQNARYAWLNSGNPEATAADAVPSPDPFWATLRFDHVTDRRITRVDVAATGPSSPVPPGIPRLPAAGEYYASPAMAEQLDSLPAEQLADRYPGSRVGTIGRSALPAPDSLLVVVGRPVDELAAAPGAVQIDTIATLSPGRCLHCLVGTDSDGIALVLSVTAAALLFPVLVFIGTATRLSAARREQRFAAMRLVGATPRQVAVVAAVESGMAAVVGTALGFALFLLMRPQLAAVPFTGERFFPADLVIGPAEAVAVALGVPLAAAASARLALRRVRISPVGVTRRVPAAPPRAWRLVPLMAGVAELLWFVGRRPETTDGQVLAYLGGIFLMMGGLVLAGPWLTMAGSRLVVRLTQRPATLVAARRLAADPRAGFRAVSGLTLALFVATTAAGVMTTMIAERGAPRGDVTAARTVLVDVAGPPPYTSDRPEPLGEVPAGLTSSLRQIDGVEGVMVLRTGELTPGLRIVRWQETAALAPCAELKTLAGLGRCAPGAEVASVPPDFDLPGERSWTGRTWPTAPLTTAELTELPVEAVVVGTGGSTSAIEGVRTALTRAFPDRGPAGTVGEQGADAGIAQQLAGFQQLAEVAVVGSLTVAGCSLAVSVIAGLGDRRRPFGLLRLTGVPLGLLRRVVGLETAVPLLLVAVAATGAGFAAAALFLRSQLDYELHPPGAGFWVLVAAGLALSLAVVGGTLPLLRRTTGPEAVRNE